jgi:ABC-type transport system involved in cytochrome c biogenesis permease subunit
MYLFVRFAAIMLIIFGILFMVGGVGAAIYGLVANEAITTLVNSMLVGSNVRVLNAGVAGSILGLVLFLNGMMLAVMGQMMMVFIDIANNTRETNLILRAFRRKEE